MRTQIIAAAIFAALVPEGRVDGCEMVFTPVSLPGPEAIRIVGIVEGYGEAMPPVLGVKRTASLRLRLDRATDPRHQEDDRTVVPLDYGPDCRSTAIRNNVLRKWYPLGARIAVSATVRRGFGVGDPMFVEFNQGGFVGVVPVSVSRTVDGDLDFGRYDYAQDWSYGLFEFDRAVQALRVAPRPQRLRRLLNLVRHPGLSQWRAGRQMLRELLSESQLSARNESKVLAAYRQSLERAR